jgi:glycosyltransferase involved in cell wall biosynthesis
VVSICCITYNHERFIAQTLNGFLMQQTDFPIEILVHDDASTDGTASIIRDFVARYPNRIRAVLRAENQYQHGRSIMPMFAEWAKGEFIALCEGDDYWTAPQKLQTQVTYLRANPDCVACCHDAVLVDEEGKTLASSYFQSAKEKFDQADVISSVLSREPTCSLVFRRSAYHAPLPQWYLRRPNDLMLDILLTCHGSLAFINSNWAAYRIHSGGIWSGSRESARIVELILRFRILLEEPYFVERYRELLLRKIGEFGSQLFTRTDAQHEVSRLDGIIRTQSEALESRQRECTRLAEREGELEGTLERTRSEAQQHIHALKAQLDTLAATAQQQRNHIAVLEKERDRLGCREKQLMEDTAHYLRVMDEQLRYIKILEAERNQAASTKS